MGRPVPAVLVVVTLVFATLGLAGWGLTRQMEYLVEDLPGYRANIRTKIADVRLAGKGSAVEKLQETLEGIKKDLGTEAPKAQTLLDAGANHVAALLTESRIYLGGLLEWPRLPVLDTATAARHTASALVVGRASA